MGARGALLLAALIGTAAVWRAQDAQDAPARLDPQAPLADARCHELLRELTPDPAAPWRSVPWQIDLLAAQRAAAAQHKPLFVWAMDGHPLACT